ncbi:unnamed protein product [[Candida] boidinii]|uniref:Unnamed protein product n=1 Tax=Candida boidinii TaxID=5477 RepID=A0A9W6WGJ2_CANBO|nr:unnamed protein product [[Candida] boidinii]GMF98097.1 unnamed protein product [[Candida] boidinii]
MSQSDIEKLAKLGRRQSIPQRTLCHLSIFAVSQIAVAKSPPGNDLTTTENAYTRPVFYLKLYYCKLHYLNDDPTIYNTQIL